MDSDGDGLRDGQEDVNLDGAVGAGETNPLQFDTDNDGMDDGWELGVTDCDPNTSRPDPLNPLDGRIDADNDGAYFPPGIPTFAH